MTGRHFLALALLLSTAVSGASAGSPLFAPSDRTGFWEFSSQIRYTGSQEYEGKAGSTLSLEDDLGWGFSIAHNFSEQFNVGLFASWRTVDYSAHVVNPNNAEQSVSWNDWMDTGNVAVFGTWNVLAKRFTPYVQGSVGWALVDSNIPESVEIDCWDDPWWGWICTEYEDTYSKEAASFALGAGVSLQVTETFLLRAGYEKSWLDLDGADNFDIFRFDAGFLYR